MIFLRALRFYPALFTSDFNVSPCPDRWSFPRYFTLNARGRLPKRNEKKKGEQGMEEERTGGAVGRGGGKQCESRTREARSKCAEASSAAMLGDINHISLRR